jgi:hypothetical protein
MIVPPGAEFTADQVIEQALRQDFGPDPSMAALKMKLKLVEDDHNQPRWEYKKKYRDNDPLLSHEHHFVDNSFVER